MKPHHKVYALLSIAVVSGIAIFIQIGQPISEGVWWVIAIITYGIGDSVSTALAVQKEGVEEAVPITRYVLGKEPRLTNILVFKSLLFSAALLYYVFQLLDNPFRKVAPVGIAIMGIIATVANLYTAYSR